MKFCICQKREGEVKAVASINKSTSPCQFFPLERAYLSGILKLAHASVTLRAPFVKRTCVPHEASPLPGLNTASRTAQEGTRGVPNLEITRAIKEGRGPPRSAVAPGTSSRAWCP